MDVSKVLDDVMDGLDVMYRAFVDYEFLMGEVGDVEARVRAEVIKEQIGRLKGMMLVKYKEESE